MNYGKLDKVDSTNGEGIRVSLFVSGCRNHCKGCFNEETWSFSYGTEFTKETEETILSYLEPDYIQGLSLLGGDPFEPENQAVLTPFLKRVKETYPQKDIWCWTGYTLETNLQNPSSKQYTSVTEEMLSYIDILVDGRFIEEQKDLTLKFRGSSNQRILQLHNKNM